MDEDKQALIQQLTTHLAFRVLLLTPEIWQIPVLKWQYSVEMRLLDIEKLKLPEAERQEAVKLAFCEDLKKGNEGRIIEIEHRFTH